VFYKPRVFYKLFLLIAVLLTTACSSKQHSPPTRYAVLRFENLTPDPSLDWMGRAVSEVLSKETGAVSTRSIYAANESFGRRPLIAPGVSTELTDALLAGGNHLITGYFERVNGKLSFTAVEEDALTGRTVASATVQGSILDACSKLARHFSPHPKPYSTNNETALRDYIQGIETGTKSAELYREAIAADPKFSDAYLAWSETAGAHGDVEAIARILEQARANQVRGPVLARLEFVEATVNKDPAARLSALKRIVEADPGDTNAVIALGESEMNGHRFAQAAAVFAKGTSPELINLRAYALMFNGEENKALSVVHEYQKALPDEANPIDSEGDIQFFFGHFSEAEKCYLRANAKDAQFIQGVALWKAARARLMTGDATGATQIFNTYRQDRIKVKDLSIDFRAATWQFLIGDHSGATASMHKAADQAPNVPLKTLALAQAAIWELQTGRTPEAIRDAETVIGAGQTPSTIAAAMVRFAAQDLASVDDLKARAEHLFNGNSAALLRQLAVGYSLIFMRRYEESLPVWKQLYEESNPNDQTFAFIYALALQKSGHTAEAAPLLKFNPIPPANLAPSFECLYLKPHGNTAAPVK
jgi:tetratricopeptide (TPR) repeat protein